MARKSYSDKEREQVKEALLITVLESIVNQGLVHSSIAILCEKVGISREPLNKSVWQLCFAQSSK